MIKRLPLLCLSMILGLAMLQAQPTITNSIFPQAGDSYEVAIATDNTIDLGQPSNQAQVWFFGDLIPGSFRVETIEDVNAGLNPGLFPNAEITQPLVQGFGTAYVDVTATAVTRIGGEADLFITQVVAPYSNTHILQQAPLTYGHNFSDPYQVNFGEHIDSVPFLRVLIDTLIAQAAGSLPFSVNPDSIRLKVTGRRTAAVDAFGQCQMPDRVRYYDDILRQKVTETRNFAIEVRVPVFFSAIWYDITPLVAGQLPFPVPLSDTTVYYDFLQEGEKQPLVRAYRNATDTETTVVEFKYMEMDTTVSIQSIAWPLQPEIKLFPNPTPDRLQVQIGDNPHGLDLQWINLQGQVFRQDVLPAGQTQGQYDFASLPRGLYMLQLRRQDTGELVAKGQRFILK